jgi:hypothetical protein
VPFAFNAFHLHTILPLPQSHHSSPLNSTLTQEASSHPHGLTP